MARFCICWLACCSLLWPSPARADSPVSAEFFLQSIEPDPSGAMLHDFLDIYKTQFDACKDTDTYLRALTYLAANGDMAMVRDRLTRLAACPGLSASARQRIAALQTQSAEIRLPLTPPVAARTTPVAETTPVPSKPAQAPEPLATMAPAAQAEPVVSEQAIPPVSPATPEPAQLAQPEPSGTPVVPPPAVKPDPPQVPPASPTTPEPAPQVAAQATPAEASAPAVQAAENAVPKTPRVAVARARKTSPRRTSLPVTPTIPMPSRIVPPSVLQPTAPAQAAPVDDAAATAAVVEPPKWRTEAASRAVYRTGHEGTSRLLRLENTLSLGYDNWTFSATALQLNAGSAGNNEFAGSYFRGRNQHALRTEQAAFIPQIAYDSESLDVSLGTSPIGGEIAPLPTGRLDIAVGRLKFAVYQESVTDTLLSYTGFRDPYTGQHMGRVLRAGARVGWDDSFAEHWFYGGALTGAYLYGENVKDNTQWRGEVYIGRTFGAFAVGSYSAVDHYQTNLNNFTFGHGGYYSPYLAASSVLFVSWEHVGQAGRIKADISSGFLYETTRDSDLYYGVDGPQGVYKGETHRRFTVNAGLEGSLNLADDLSLNSSLRVINAGDFTEARGALYLKWAF